MSRDTGSCRTPACFQDLATPRPFAHLARGWHDVGRQCCISPEWHDLGRPPVIICSCLWAPMTVVAYQDSMLV
ncbi:hypothetical protein IQ07DRAFT_589284 [Pyrenochaeta sp. DS3sAY3a]|nr:hypothetical protein IQ07DRAFT_589284 [Pyrenochaeta sp. DS3sAY3a]